MLPDLFNASVVTGLGVLPFSCHTAHIMVELPVILLLLSCSVFLNALTGCDAVVALLPGCPSW